ncbi:hypothetical protein JXA59_02680 [Patescibacteria group bacterium]|nr:hypothetical protein [Patescibacteria group bacterium]
MKNWNTFEKVAAIVAVLIVLGGIAWYVSQDIPGSSAFTLPQVDTSQTVFLSDQGDDQNDGSHDSPVRSFSRAFALVSEFYSPEAEPAQVIVDGEEYHLTDVDINSTRMLGFYDGERVVVGRGNLPGLTTILPPDAHPQTSLTFGGRQSASILVSGFDFQNVQFVLDARQGASIQATGNHFVNNYPSDGNVLSFGATSDIGSQVSFEKNTFVISRLWAENQHANVAISTTAQDSGLIHIFKNEFVFPTESSNTYPPISRHGVRVMGVRVTGTSGGGRVLVEDNIFSTLGFDGRRNINSSPNNPFYIGVIALSKGGNMRVDKNDFSQFVGSDVVAQGIEVIYEQEIGIFNNRE